MKRYFVLLAFAILILQRTVFASPVINNISFDPSPNIQLSESVNIIVNCTDNITDDINVYAQVTGSGLIIPNPYFTRQGDLFVTTLGSYLFNNTPNNFSVNVSCEDSNGYDNAIAYFSVFNFSNFINSISPSTIYLGDSSPIVVNVIVKNNNVMLGSGVNFTLTLDGNVITPKGVSYLSGIGWNLYLERPADSNPAVHSLQITASYDRFRNTQSTAFTVQNPIQFYIKSIDRSWVNPNDTINIQIQAFDRGGQIPINLYNPSVQVGSTPASIISITPMGNYFNIAAQMPTLSSGIYQLMVLLSYPNSTYPISNSTNIYYTVPISGKITDENGNGVSAQLRFLSSGVQTLKIYTDSNGAYTGNLPPGTYDVQATFSKSNFYLQEVPISSFNDPIKYFYSTDDVVPGIRNAGLFSYGIELSYVEANVEMNYDEGKVLNENDLTVFECPDWNSGRKVCNDQWSEVGSDIDTIGNLVTINSTSLSTFMVGERKTINANFNLDSQSYYTGSSIKVTGLLKDEDGDAVSNATVKLYVKNTPISVVVSSDNNGVFSFEFNAPGDEGNYTLVLSAEKSPYISFSGEKYFSTFKSREITIVTPDTIELKQGQNSTQEFSITNTGQADLSGLNVSLSGIPSSYYNMSDFIGRLRQNEEVKVYVQFSIPEDAKKQTYSASLEVLNTEIKQDKIFGFTIIGKNDTTEQATPTNPSGNFILPEINLSSLNSSVVYIAIFAVICFSVAIILKKRKIRRAKRDDIKGFLFDVKDSLKKVKVETAPKPENNYKDLILKEFPNSISEDEYGKNN